MSAFDKIIGYDAIKEELSQICDMIKNPDIYKPLGARLPKGILIIGEPGLGKTLMAKCFIEECGLENFVIRRNGRTGDFTETITETFNEAADSTVENNAPVIVLLDDLDKFANEDTRHRDAEEYVAVQAGIDDVKDLDIFVIATVNDADKLPDSLTRAGRFDRKIEVSRPDSKSSELIIRHYLADKKISADANLEDFARMMSFDSCAELETIINEAAVNAGFARRTCIGTEDLVKAVIRLEYNSYDDNYTCYSMEDRKRTALHEAGHVVVSEALCPGSVGFAYSHSPKGFIHRCEDFSHDCCYALVSLAGKAAVELYHSESFADGCSSDIHKACKIIRGEIKAGAKGFGMVCPQGEVSEDLGSRFEAVTQAELERYMFKTRDILLKNREFLEKTAEELAEKEILLYSDIRGIRESTGFSPAFL